MNPKRRLTDKLQQLNRKSVLLTFLISYFIIFLIPFSLGAIFYLKTETAVEEQETKTNQAMLEQVREVVDGNLKEVEQLMLQIALNPKVKDYVNRISSSQSLNPYEYVDLKNTLHAMNTTRRFVYDYFIYFLDANTIVTPGTKSAEELFYTSYYSYPGLSLNQWKTMLEGGYHYLRYFPAKPILRDDPDARMMFVQQSLPIEDKVRPRTALMIVINEQSIRDLFKHIEFAELGNMFIVNENGQVMASSNDNLPDTEKMIAHFRSGSYSYFDHSRGEEMIISHTRSRQTSWYYVSAIPRSSFMGKIQVIRNWALLAAALSFIIGIIAILYMSMRQYNPVKKIMAALPKLKSDSGENEYSLILKNIENVQHEEKQVRELLKAQAPLIRANFLTRLLRGQIDGAALDAEAMAPLDIDIRGKWFSILLVGIDDINSFDSRDTEESWALARFIITNIGLDVIRGRHRAEAVELDINRMAFVLCLDADPKDSAREELNQLVEKFHTFLRIRFKMELTLGVSGIHDALADIHVCYEEAVKALDYKIIKGSNSAIYYEGLTSSVPSYHYPLDVETHLINATKAGDVDKVEKLITELIEANFRSHNLSPLMSKYLFFNIVSTLIKVIDMFNIKPDAVWERDRLDPITLYAECGTSDKMKSELIRAYSEVCRLLKSERKPATLTQAQQIVQFIQQRFGDGNLSLTAIGDTFGMNPHYLSSFFKKHTGQNLADFIAQVRVQEAKRLLLETSLTIPQIAESVGYANDVGFTRMFKKLEGITPGKFRELK